MYKWIKNKGLIEWDDDFIVAHADKAFKVKRFLNFVNKLRESTSIDNRKVEKVIDLYITEQIDIDIREASNDFDIIKLEPGSVEE
jgi:hypothetical protein|tara:strand:+ start:10475 stop:10729 length:255 start_codon:yes stop_codon:yes gene_type:complete